MVPNLWVETLTVTNLLRQEIIKTQLHYTFLYLSVKIFNGLTSSVRCLALRGRSRVRLINQPGRYELTADVL